MKDERKCPCRICGSTGTTRHISEIYVYGSEGLNICTYCENEVLTFIRAMSGVATRAAMEVHKRRKAEGA